MLLFSVKNNRCAIEIIHQSEWRVDAAILNQPRSYLAIKAGLINFSMAVAKYRSWHILEAYSSIFTAEAAGHD